MVDSVKSINDFFLLILNFFLKFLFMNIKFKFLFACLKLVKKKHSWSSLLIQYVFQECFLY